MPLLRVVYSNVFYFYYCSFSFFYWFSCWPWPEAWTPLLYMTSSQITSRGFGGRVVFFFPLSFCFWNDILTAVSSLIPPSSVASPHLTLTQMETWNPQPCTRILTPAVRLLVLKSWHFYTNPTQQAHHMVSVHDLPALSLKAQRAISNRSIVSWMAFAKLNISLFGL